MAMPLLSLPLQPSRRTCHTFFTPVCFIRPTLQPGISPKSVVDGMFSRRDVLENLTSVILLRLGQDIENKTAQANEQDIGIERCNGNALSTINCELRKVLKRSKAAGLLRLAFHDAGTFNIEKQTGGMNGSIVYELHRPENFGLDRSLKILAPVKASLDSSLSVSWADLIAVAGAEGIALCGGPIIPIRLGRLDATIPDPDGELPTETLDVFSLKKNFMAKGFTTSELVVLSGAHTLGRKGFGNPLVFDNSYFKVLLQKPWTQTGNEMGSMIGLPTDRALVDDDECLRWINCYADAQSKFFEDFSAAYVKLVDSGAKWRIDI